LAAAGYTIRMVITSIRELNRAVPFKPYKIQMVSGENFIVPHPDLVFVSPKGSFVIFFEADETPHHLSALMIESVSPFNAHRVRKSGKRR
jgi:hypothetical protein